MLDSTCFSIVFGLMTGYLIRWWLFPEYWNFEVLFDFNNLSKWNKLHLGVILLSAFSVYVIYQDTHKILKEQIDMLTKIVSELSGESEMKKEENDEKDNDFVKLVEDFPNVIEEADLKKLLDSKMDLLSKIQIWRLTSVITLVLAFGSLKLAFDFSSYIGWALIVVTIVLVIYFIYGISKIGKKDPFQDQKKIMENYLEGKRRLNELKQKDMDKPSPANHPELS